MGLLAARGGENVGDFAQRTRELEARVGHGKLEGKVAFDQIYAAPQEVGYWVTGPNAGIHIEHYTTPGTGAHYLGGPLLEGAPMAMRTLADGALEPDGLNRGMTHNVERLADDSSHRAPREVGDLSRSAHPSVKSDGATVYDRPPEVPRLSEAELRAKAKLAEGRAVGNQRGRRF